MAGEIVRVHRDLVRQNPFAPQCTRETMMTEMAKIGTVKQWTEKFGRDVGHDAIITDNVARLLNEGTKKWDEEDPPMQVAPGATPATWWIYLNADNNKDKELYAKFAICAQDFHPFEWNTETTEKWAVAFLRVVKDEMTDVQGQWLYKQQQAFDAYVAGAGPIMG